MTKRPRGRPRRYVDGQRLDYRITIRCTEDEYDEWLEIAENAGISVSEWARRRIKGVRITKK